MMRNFVRIFGGPYLITKSRKNKKKAKNHTAAEKREERILIKPGRKKLIYKTGFTGRRPRLSDWEVWITVAKHKVHKRKRGGLGRKYGILNYREDHRYRQKLQGGYQIANGSESIKSSTE